MGFGWLVGWLVLMDVMCQDSDTAAVVVRPRPRMRTASQESLDRSVDDEKPQPQPAYRARPRAAGSQDSLDRSLDQSLEKPVPSRQARGSVDSVDDKQQPTPALRAGRHITLASRSPPPLSFFLPPFSPRVLDRSEKA